MSTREYGGSMMNDLANTTDKVCAAAERRADLHLENNSAFRQYLASLAEELIKRGNELVRPDDPQFIEKINIQRGWIRAGIFVLDRVAKLRNESYEEYGS